MKARPRSKESAGDPVPSGTEFPLAEWLRSYVEHSPTAVAIIGGPADTLMYTNVAFRDLSARGGAPSGARTGRPLAEAFNPAAAQSLAALLAEACREGRPARAQLAADQIGGTGTWRCAAWSANDTVGLSESEDQSDLMVIEVDESSDSDIDDARRRDLTERLLLSAIREEARAVEADAARSRAEQARAAHSRLLADVSHEIRTPMQAIIAYTTVIERGLQPPLSSLQHEALSAIRDSTRHVIALIAELMRYTTSAERSTDVLLTRVRVETTLRAAASLVTPQAHAKGVDVRIMPGREEAAVSADAAKLLQVALNLLDNAVKFTPANGTITISWDVVSAADDQSERIAIRIADTGRGIASEELAAVFDPYIQVGQHGALGDAGVGLGLAISRELVRGMRGELVVTSKPSVGSIFTVSLPSA